MLRRLTTAVVATTALALASAAPALAQEDPGPASGSGVQPTFVAGNPTCADVTDTEFVTEFKLEPVSSGTFPLPGGLDGDVTLVVHDDGAGPLFDFSFTGDFVTATVIVKGGPNANFYDYRPDGTAADTNLHAPVNPSNNKFYGLSHISFCLIEVEDETPPPTTPPPTETETPTPTPPPTEPETPKPTPPGVDDKTPKPVVPTSVPAGYGQADNGSAGTIGLLAFVTALAIGGAALVTRRFLKDN